MNMIFLIVNSHKNLPCNPGHVALEGASACMGALPDFMETTLETFGIQVT